MSASVSEAAEVLYATAVWVAEEYLNKAVDDSLRRPISRVGSNDEPSICNLSAKLACSDLARRVG
jgi:hypothetical protein